MAFKDNILEFSDTKIIDTNSESEVMMNWEDDIMKKSAEYICESKGDILEIGFGMGICADYIQAQDVKSHTIIEIHPQIIERLKAWAEDKNNVIILEGDWYTAEGLKTYDGIFLDTFGDENIDHGLMHRFKEFVLPKANPNAKLTYWNSYNGVVPRNDRNVYGFDKISYEAIPVTPVECDYIYHKQDSIVNRYYMPKVGL